MFRTGIKIFGYWALIVFAALTVYAFAAPVEAQSGGRYAAAVTASGQLIVSDPAGTYRWIVTNPGEALAAPIGFAWSPRGDRLAFAVDLGGTISLRVGTLAAQTTVEIGQLPAGAVSGAAWTPDGAGVFAASSGQIAYFDAGGAGTAGVVASGTPVTVLSPFANPRPYLPQPASVSPDGRSLFYQNGDGRYALIALDGSTALALTGANEANATGAGLWADTGPLVAYWGYEATAVLNVTHAGNGQTLTLDSGRSAPVPPLAWLPGTTTLIYRAADGVIRAADVGCMAVGCPANPLEAGIDLLPSSAADVQPTADGTLVVYRDGGAVLAVPTSCLAAGTCASAGVVVGLEVAPDRPVHVGGRVLAYTAGGSVMVADLGCVSAGACAATPVLAGSAGLVAPDGSAVIAAVADGLAIIDLRTGTTAYLADAGSTLLAARWNG